MKKKTLKVVVLIAFVIIAITALIIYKVYNKPHRSAESEDAIAITAGNLVTVYEKDEKVANSQYLDKAIQVTGKVADTSSNQQNMKVITLHGSDMSGVQCTLVQYTMDIKIGDSVIIKGFCTGYLTDVIIDRCVVVNLK